MWKLHTYRYVFAIGDYFISTEFDNTTDVPIQDIIR